MTQTAHRGIETTPPWPAKLFRPTLRRVWDNRRIGLVLAAVLAAGFGMASAWLTPRGPITTTEALMSMAVALLVGLGAGWAMANRWALLVIPVVFAAVFELARLGVDGPTVDGIHLASMYGVIAFVVGRLVHGLLVLAPMVLGASYGIWAARRLGKSRTPAPSLVGWAFTGLLTVLVLAVAVLVARPASTAPIVGPSGEPLTGSVAELITVPIGGHDQTMMIRGRSSENPVLLYLAGGPGGTDMGAIRADVSLEQEFVVVTWDQRGAGKSYSALDPAETLTLGQTIADTIEVTNYLRDRFDENKIYLVGNSWGTTLGVLAAQQHPELFHAFVGTGQMVSQRETDIMFWEDTLTWADRTGNQGLAETLQTIGPPPYDDLLDYEPAISHEHDWNVYPEFDSGIEMPAILFVPEYSWMDRINGFRSFLDTFSVLYPQLQEIDFRVDAPRLDLPVYMVLGEHEARGRAVLALQWFDILDAPSKELIVFEGAGHRPHFDQPGRFAGLMTQVLADTHTDTGSDG